jgi:hypothetical protein
MWILIGTRRYNKALVEFVDIDPQDNKYLVMRIANKDYRIAFASSSAASSALTEILGADTIVNLNDN